MYCIFTQQVDYKTECLASYIGDLCLLHTEFGRYSPAMTAASIICLANSIFSQASPWPVHMVEMTGLGLSYLFECILHLHQKWYVGFPEALPSSPQVALI